VRRMSADQDVGRILIVHLDKSVVKVQRSPLESVKTAVTLVTTAQSDRNAKREHVQTHALGSRSAAQMPSVWL